MASIEVKHDYAQPADVVWKELSDFGGIGNWMPGIESMKVEGEGVGAIRRIGMPGGMTIVERLEAHDDTSRSFSYSITEGPMPVQNYLATITVSEQGTGSHVDWTADFDLPEGLPVEAIQKGLEGAYGGALKALAARLG